MSKNAEDKLKQAQLDKFLKKNTSLINSSIIELSSEDDQTPLKLRDPVKVGEFKENHNEMSSKSVVGKSLFTFKTPKASNPPSQLPSDVKKTCVEKKQDVNSVLSSLQGYELPSYKHLCSNPPVAASQTSSNKSSFMPKLVKTKESSDRPKDVPKEIKPLPVVSKSISSRQMAFLDDDDDEIILASDKRSAKESQSLFNVKTSTSSKLPAQKEKNLELPKSRELKSSKEEENFTIISTPVEEIVKSGPSIKIDTNSVMSDYERLRKDNQMDSMDGQQLINEQLKFYKHFYDIHNQIPLTMYENIEGYDKALVLKIKSMITSLNLRIKRKESRNQIASLVNGIKLKNVSPKKHDDQFDVDEVMQEVQNEKQICNGKFNNHYVDLSSPSTSSAFQPRINMKNQTNFTQSANSSYTSNHNDTNLDNDGFPMFDYSQLVDVLPSQSAASTNRDSIAHKNTGESTQSSDPNSSLIGIFHDNVPNDGITGEFDKTFSFSQEIRNKFKYTFGLHEFRQNQLQAINAGMLNMDCFILMPTGGGKSLCYQLPAVCCEGVSIVVSPLKSLIFDQVNKLNTLDIKAAALSGDLSAEDARQIYSDINSAKPKIKLLYTTPEKITASTSLQETFSSMYSRGTLARFVIDEAHCVSTWGHDFRPDYKRLGELKKRFPNVPIMALTATANPRVRKDVTHQLVISECKWFLSSFNRPNLKYVVTPKKGSSTLNDIIALIKAKYAKASGIIYCLSRRDCETTAEKLQFANIKAICYHAGLSDKVREKVQQDWITDKHKVVCATIAFGMGIDKPDVRYVIHYSLPKSIEGYYQEAGRAGRDGKDSICILYYNYGDKIRYLNMIQKEPPACQQVSRNNLDLVVNFCENMVDCRRAVILNYFGEHFTREQCLQNESSACDNCKRTEKYKVLNVTDISKKIVNGVRELCARNRFTVLQLVDVFKGATTKKITDFGHNNTSYHASLKTWEKSDIQRLFHKLILEHYLTEEIVVLRDIPQSYIKVGTKAGDLMQRGSQVKFSIMEQKKVTNTKKKAEVPRRTKEDDEHEQRLVDLQEKCYMDLMDVAKRIAEERHTSVPNLVHMEAIREMSIRLPETEQEMLKIPHITKANFEKFGSQFLEVIVPYWAQRSSYEMDRVEEIEEAAAAQNCQSSDDDGSDDEGSGVNWDQLGSQASSGSNYRGYKRKSTSNWGGKKVLKKYKGSKSKKKTPAKKNNTSQKGKNSSLTSKAWSASKAGGSSGGARKNNLLPPPKPTF